MSRMLLRRPCFQPARNGREGLLPWWFTSCLLLAALTPVGALAANVGRPAVVQRSTWNGFSRLDFTVAGRPAVLVFPTTAAQGKPWIWRTEFFDHQPQVDLALLARGWHLAYIDVKNMYGGPKAMGFFGHFYAHVVV